VACSRCHLQNEGVDLILGVDHANVEADSAQLFMLSKLMIFRAWPFGFLHLDKYVARSATACSFFCGPTHKPIWCPSVARKYQLALLTTGGFDAGG
jgi:hypothetical protein